MGDLKDLKGPQILPGGTQSVPSITRIIPTFEPIFWQIIWKPWDFLYVICDPRGCIPPWGGVSPNFFCVGFLVEVGVGLWQYSICLLSIIYNFWYCICWFTLWPANKIPCLSIDNLFILCILVWTYNTFFPFLKHFI